MKRTLAFALAFLMMFVVVTPQAVAAEESDNVSLVTHQMSYVNQFFNEDGSWSEMGLELCKWLDMSKRDVVDRIDSGYLMLEEEYLYQQDTLLWEKSATYANFALDTISSKGSNVIGMATNHFAMMVKFGTAGAFAIPYYEFLTDIYLSYIQCLEQEMEMMDTALEAIISNVEGGEGALRESLPVVIGVLEKSPGWNLLSEDQRRSLRHAKKAIRSEASPYRNERYQNYVDDIGIVFDFASTAASWQDTYNTKKNLSIQQQLYMSALNAVTDEHLDMLINLHENLHKHSSLSKSELTNIDGAIGALLCDIFSARNGQMKAAAHADWNAKLGTVNALSGALFSTATLTGFNPIVNGLSSIKGFSAVSAFATLGSFILKATTQDYLDIREQTKAIYNLKKSITEVVELQLSDYATNPTHEQAVSIIASLKLLKQAKRSGEEAISLFYIAKEANMLGLENSPAAQAILWNEVITSNALNEYDLEANNYIKPIWTVYQNEIVFDLIYNGVVNCHIESTPIAYYRYDESNVSYRGGELRTLPTSVQITVKDGLWNRTDDDLKAYFKNPYIKVTWDSRKYANPSEDTMSQIELENLSQIALEQNTSPVHKIESSKLNPLNRIQEYVYSRGNVEVRIPVDEFEKYLEAESWVKQLMNEYRNVSSLEYKNHQVEERLIWTKVTNGYIESFPMYDPLVNYEETVEEPTVTPEPTLTWETAVETFHYRQASTSESGNGRIELQIGTEYFDRVITVNAMCHAFMSMDPPSDESYPYFYFTAPHSGDYAISVKPFGIAYNLYFYAPDEAGELEMIASMLLHNAQDEINTVILSDVPAGTKIYWESQNELRPMANSTATLEMKISPME